MILPLEVLVGTLLVLGVIVAGTRLIEPATDKHVLLGLLAFFATIAASVGVAIGWAWIL